MTSTIDLIDLLPDLPDAVALFPDRRGGVSPPPWKSLNFGFSTDDARDNVVANRERLADAARVPLDRWVVRGQVHGARVSRVDLNHAGEGAREPGPRGTAADAVYLTEPGVFALALTADCPLVVVADPARRVIGVAHSGWRGTAAGVVGALVEAFRSDGSPLEALRVAIAPAICGTCYPVGEEVHHALRDLPGYAEAAGPGRGVDLRRLQRAGLEAAGVPAEAIVVHSDCSACLPERYFSYRRDAGRTGRGGVLVGWRP